MASVNKVIIVGNLGSDPDLRDAKGTPVCTFSVATSEKRGERDETEWHRVTCFSKTAENCGRFLKKGRSVYVEGRIRTRQYEKDGEKRYVTEIVADRVQFLGGGDREEGSAGGVRRGGSGGATGGRTSAPDDEPAW